MAQFVRNAQRLDPYKSLKFRLSDGTGTHFGSKLTGLLAPPEVIEHPAGTDSPDSHKSPGRTKYDAVTLDRGVTHDQTFSDWASQVWNYGAAANSQRAIHLELCDEAGQ